MTNGQKLYELAAREGVAQPLTWGNLHPAAQTAWERVAAEFLAKDAVDHDREMRDAS